MRRFVSYYLTVSAVVILLTNLALIVFYARQYSLHAELPSDCQTANCLPGSVWGDFIVVNGILVGLLLIIWFAVVTLASAHSRRPDRP